MSDTKRVVILVIVAIILAITAVSMQLSGSEEVATERPTEAKRTAAGAGTVGLVISESADVEDRGNTGGTTG